MSSNGLTDQVGRLILLAVCFCRHRRVVLSGICLSIEESPLRNLIVDQQESEEGWPKEEGWLEKEIKIILEEKIRKIEEEKIWGDPARYLYP